MAWHNKYQSDDPTRIKYTMMREGGNASSKHYIYIYNGSKFKVWDGSSSTVSFSDSSISTNTWNSSTMHELTSNPTGTTAITGASGTVYYANVSSGGCIGKWAWYLNSAKTYIKLDKWTEEYTLTVTAQTDGSTSTTGGTVSGGGSYESGTVVTLTASSKTNYTFSGWYNSSGTRLSTSASYWYTTGSSATTVYGRFISNTTTYYTVTVTASTGGRVNTSGGSYASGTSIFLEATPDSGYRFSKWLRGSTTYTTVSSFNYTVNANANFTAVFELEETETNVTFNLDSDFATTRYIESFSNTAINATLNGTLAGGSTYYNYPVGYTAESPHSYSTNMYASKDTTAYIDYSFNFSNLPSNYSIKSIEVKCYGGAESSSSTAKCTLYTSNGIEKESANFTSTSNSIITISSESWTRAQLLNAKLRFTVGYYGGRICGITWKVTCYYNSNITKTLTYNQTTNNIVGQNSINFFTDSFLGWYTNSTGGTQVFDKDGKYTTNSTYWNSGKWNYTGSSLTLYAHWQLYTLTAIANGGSIPSTTGWSPAGASSEKSKQIPIGASYSNCGYWPIPLKTDFDFLGWFSSSSSTSSIYQFTDSDGEISDYDAVWDYYDGSGYWIGTSNLTLYAGWYTEPTYTLTIKYHLNGGTIADRVHQQNSTNYWTYKEDNLIYKCTNSNGGSPTLWTHTFTCKPSESSSTSVNLTNVSSFGITREGCSVPSGTTAWRSGPRSGTIISQDNTTVYAVLGNQNLTENKEMTVYVNWNASTYALDIQYDLNGGALTSTVTSYTNSSTGVTTYFKARSDGLLCECNSAGNQMVPLRTHLEYDYYNDFRNLWNVSSYKAQKTNYTVETTKEYITNLGVLINQDTESASDTNAATVQRMSGTTVYADRVVTLFINWASNNSNIYVKIGDNWTQGILYIKTANGWVQGNPYVKTSNGWQQGT